MVWAGASKSWFVGVEVGMQEDIQEALEQLLAIEREAKAIVERARAQAATLRAQGSRRAGAIRQQLLTEAHRQAEEMIATARAEAERARERRLSEAGRVAEVLERSAQRSMDAAVRFVTGELLGEPAAKAGREGAVRRAAVPKRRAA